MKNRLFHILFFLLVSLLGVPNNQVAAQQTFPGDSMVNGHKNRLAILPVFYYTPETRFAFGATGLYFFRFPKDSSNSRISIAQVLAAYTLNKQILLSLPFNIFWQQNKYWLNGQVAFYRYPYVFNGIGNDRPAGYEESYTPQFPRLHLRALQKITPQIYAGLRVRLQDTRIVFSDDSATTNNGLVDAQVGTNAIPGGTGGFTSGLGFAINFDSRDKIFFPTKGHFIQLSNLHQTPFFLSDFAFDTYSLDLRKYWSINQSHIFAVQGFAEFNYGTIPFNRMALLGGPNLMRGYRRGIYRDKKQLVFQGEYRSPYWKSMGLVLFTGYGGIANKTTDFNLQDMRLTYGAGWRWRLEQREKISLRVDIGFGENGNSELYFTVNEAF